MSEGQSPIERYDNMVQFRPRSVKNNFFPSVQQRRNAATTPSTDGRPAKEMVADPNVHGFLDVGGA